MRIKVSTAVIITVCAATAPAMLTEYIVRDRQTNHPVESASIPEPNNLKQSKGEKQSTTLNYREQTRHEYRQTDAKLAGIVEKIKLWYGGDEKFIKAFDASQLAWQKYRDAQMTMIFPETEDPQLHYGSSFRLVFPAHLTGITKKRIEELTIWIEGVEEGELGFRSVLRKEDIDKLKAGK
ncbi:MAG: DUF1311 domain-containing protein [Phycisphaerales bacterium]|nr:DUF1311 domain-containing protein [Phycisphaerales bacterium]